MRIGVLASLAVVMFTTTAVSEDWPTYLGDSARSGVTRETLTLPLNVKWVHSPRYAPSPAWPAPAIRDIWHELRELNPLVTYDRAFQPVIAGGRLYFGSSADDKVYCLDAKTGETLWTFFTEGPVRLAPTIADGRVYFGSDDGCAYCLDAATGKLVWKFRPGVDRRIPGNGRVISTSPLRTGIVVDNGVAYFFAGLFPPADVYRCALNATTGETMWSEKTDELSPQGYLLASPTRLFVPSGRTAPYLFDRQTAQPLGQMSGSGGAYALLMDTGVVSGPGRREPNTLSYSEPGKNETIASFPGIRMIVNGDWVYLQSKDQLSALNRTKYLELSRERNKYLLPLDDLKRKSRVAFASRASDELQQLKEKIADCEKNISRLTTDMDACYTWKKPAADPFAMILAADTLFVGQAGAVIAVNTADGAEKWRADINGDVHGLCVANGNLFASSSDGAIYCFAPEQATQERRVTAEDVPDFSGPVAKMCEEAASAILAQSKADKGYCIVIGSGEGELAYALAKQSNLNIVCVEKDAERAAAARAALDKAGVYGVRVVVHHIDKGALPYTGYMANLVVSQDALMGKVPEIPLQEIVRLLKPIDGVAIIGQTPAAARKTPLDAAKLKKWIGGDNAAEIQKSGGLWAVFRGPAIPGTGEWTQLYANAGHTACSGDQLREPMAIQWFGNPGPREMVDRHHRPMASLFKSGRVFVPGDNRVISLDAYNGTELWRLDVPESRRVGAMKNSGQMLVTDDLLYIATGGECWTVNVATGERAQTLQAPQPDSEPADWGYMDVAGDRLIGSIQKRDASFDELSLDMVHHIEGDFRQVIISDGLFALDRHSGRQAWTYQGGGKIMNSAIAMIDNRLCFVESRNEKSLANKDGRIRIDHFCGGDTYLIALDVNSGNKLWERPIALPYQHIMFLSGSDGVLLATGSFNDNKVLFYELFGMDAESGKDLWQTKFEATDPSGKKPADLDGTHGEQWQHPVIIAGFIYSRPYAFDLHTGAKKDYVAYRGGSGCGGLTGSAYYLYGRGSNPRMYPTETNQTEGIQLTRVSRPGCWLNIIPAGGLVLIPESSSGCTCAYPMQTSVALAPVASVLPK